MVKVYSGFRFIGGEYLPTEIYYFENGVNVAVSIINI